MGDLNESVKSPQGSAGVHATRPRRQGRSGVRSRWDRFVPLSVFFDRMGGADGEHDEDAMYGFHKPGSSSRNKGDGKSDAEKQNAKTHRSGEGKGSAQQSGGGPDQADKALASEAVVAVRYDQLHERGSGEGTLSRPHKCKWCKAQADDAVIWADGRAFIPTCKKHRNRSKHQIEVVNNDEIEAIRPLPVKESTVSPAGMPVKSGASHGAIHGTGTGNVATAPVPLGPPLRRMRKRKKKKDRKRWIERLINKA